MIKLIARPLQWLRWLFGLLFPMFSSTAAAEEFAHPAGRWTARCIVVAAVLLVLALVNRAEAFGLQNWIPYGALGKSWLPLFALCLYALVWLGWWLYRILNADIGDEPSEFPDLDRAWAQATEALQRVDIQLDMTPLFLVLGWTAGSEEPLFQAAGLRAQVKQVPRDPTEPLHVTADREGIWVTCPGASFLGQLDPSWTGLEGSGDEVATLLEEGPDPYKTMGFGQGGETLRVEDFLASLKKAQARGGSIDRPRRTIDRERYRARLQHLCRLIRRDRRGFCPINGILVVLPITAADPKSGPEEIAEACRSDLAEVLSTFRLRCPILFLVTGLERLEGFSELIERLPAGQSGKRMGQRFPLVPELGDGEVPRQIQSSVEWISNGLFGSMVYSLFQVEASREPDDLAQVLKGNQQLYRFLSRIRERSDRLARLVRDCLPAMPGERVNFGGCYFAGVGEDPATEQAFASGVLKRLIQDQDLVTWTQDALREDEARLRLAGRLRWILGTLIAAGILTILTLLGYHLLRSEGAEETGV